MSADSDYDGLRDVINALTEASLIDKTKDYSRGCAVNQEFTSQIGAEYCGRGAGSAAALLEKILTETKGK